MRCTTLGCKATGTIEFWNKRASQPAPGGAGGTPDGWQLVPKEPTGTMAYQGELAGIAYIAEARGDMTIREARPFVTVEIYRAMLSASPAPPHEGDGQWREIESAPKDGAPIFVASKETGRAYIAKWNPTFDAWTDELGTFDGPICKLTVTGCWETSDAWFQPNEVTHWMPLPAAPHQKPGE